MYAMVSSCRDKLRGSHDPPVVARLCTAEPRCLTEGHDGPGPPLDEGAQQTYCRRVEHSAAGYHCLVSTLPDLVARKGIFADSTSCVFR